MHIYSVEQSSSCEANRFSGSQKFPAFYGTRRYITASAWLFRYMICFYVEDLLAPRPNPQPGGPPPVGCPRLLFQYIRSYPPYWRPFLHPQPEEAPCRGDRDPPIKELSTTAYSKLPHLETVSSIIRRWVTPWLQGSTYQGKLCL